MIKLVFYKLISAFHKLKYAVYKIICFFFIKMNYAFLYKKKYMYIYIINFKKYLIMKRSKLLLIGFVLLSTLFTTTSCKKECPKPPEPTKTELLTAHEWLGVKAVEYTNGTQTNQLSLSNFKFLFAVNNDYFVYDNNSISEYGNWEIISGSPDVLRLTPNSSSPRFENSLFNYNDNGLRSSLSNSYRDFKIDKIDENSFIFYYEEVNSSGDNIKIEYEFKK